MECTHAMWWKIPKLVNMILILKYENIKIYEYKKRIYRFLIQMFTRKLVWAKENHI